MRWLASELRDAKARSQRIIDEAASSVEALIHMVEVPDFPGETARARVDCLLRLTASRLPGLQMALFPHDDSGFPCDLADQRFYLRHEYWADFVRPYHRTSNQVGHFLTAVGLGLNRWPRLMKLRLIVGHEKFGDHHLGTFLFQFLLANPASVHRFLEAVEADRDGDVEQRDRLLFQILGARTEAVRSRHRIGNSVPDLRLSVKGWRFAAALRTGEVLTPTEAADWLRREIFDPSRVRVRVPPGVPAGVPC